MAVCIIRCWQVLIAVLIAAGIVLMEVEMYGPDIDGRTPSLADTLQGSAIEAVIIGAFVVAGMGLFRWHKVGWWLSITLDGLLALAAAAMVVGDFTDRFMVTQEGRNTFRGDLIIHATALLICGGAIGLLLLTRTRFLDKTGKTTADAHGLPPSPLKAN
jgi:hypothetical protein